MSSYGAPPLPNRPYDASRSSPPPPPIPPLPKGYNPNEDQESMYNTQPHLSAPMLAPRPHKVTPDLPANMAATLDAQSSASQYRGSSPMPTPGSQAYPRGPSPNPPPPPPAFPMAYTPQPPSSYSNGSLAPSHSYSGSYGGSPAPSNNNDWSPWAIPPPSHTPLPAPGGMNTPPRSYAASPALPQPQLPASGPLPDIHAGGSLIASMDALTFSSAPQPRHPMPERHATTYSTYGPQKKTPSPPPGAVPSLTAPLPTIASLYAGLTTIERAGPDAKIQWARDVLSLVERAQPPERAPGPARLEDPELARLATQHAIPIILSICSSAQAPPHPKATAEAFYHRACLANTGDFPDLVQPSARLAFRDFEAAARAGYHPAWFKLGRDYETVQDATHARDCFERGAKHNVESCLYRMGMAHLLGQLGLQASPQTAVPLLHRAATLASVTVPQPAYVFGLLLIDQFAQVSIPQHLFAPVIPPGSDAPSEARRHLERAAYLNFAPAQYKLGHAYEFAMGPFPFDPLLSVQYYSLASQQGEPEADMSLSKWFLCGAEGCFEKDEGLAYTFAEKAARRGLPSAEFAMGYYAEVGVGGPKDIDNARKWYQRATEHGNEDAKGRLAALSAPQAQALSRDEHENLTQNTLVRKRTQAKQASDARRPQGQPAQQGQQGQGQRPPLPRADANEAVALARRSSKINHAGPGGSVGLAQGRRPSAIPENVAAGPGGHGRRPSGQVPPDGHRVPSHSNSTPAGPGPQGQQQYNPNAPRYNLSDRPSSSASGSAHPGGPGRQQTAPASAQQGPGSRPGSSAGGRPQQPQGPVPPMPTSTSSPPAQNKPPEMKYQTFAQMGIQGAKAEEKDCVIM